MFTANEEQEMVPQETKVYLWLKKYLPLAAHDGGGRYVVRENGRPVYTTLFVVIVLLAVVDLVFALDSIPAVMGISLNRMVIYTSNIFAVLGLRSLFFLLRSAVSKFDYLQQGIAFVLIFIGSKMLAEPWIVQWIDSNTQVVLSLLVIVSSIAGSILYSIYHQKRGVPPDIR
jgi:tellurite resistance protein TerC